LTETTTGIEAGELIGSEQSADPKASDPAESVVVAAYPVAETKAETTATDTTTTDMTTIDTTTIDMTAKTEESESARPVIATEEKAIVDDVAEFPTLARVKQDWRRLLNLRRSR
jgi:hypothetical protein